MIDLGSIGVIVDRPGATAAPTTPRPTPANPFPAPFPSGPRVTDAVDLVKLAALLDAIAQDPPVGALLDDLARAAARCREVSS